MTDDSAKEKISTKILLLVLDKLVLALVLAGAVFFFNYILQEEKVRGDYQKQLFDRRMDAYVSILKNAKECRDLLELLYHPSQETLGGLQRRERLEELKWRAENLGKQSGFSRDSVGLWGPESVMPPLLAMERIMRESDLYISRDVRDGVAEFIDRIYKDIQSFVEEREAENKKKAGEKENEDVIRENDMSRWMRAEAAYRTLLDIVREKLRVERLVIG